MKKSLISAAFNRVSQLTRDSVAAISVNIKPPKEDPKAPKTDLDGLRSAGKFLHNRIEALGGSTPSSGKKGQVKASEEGIAFLQKRIFEMLLGIALCIECNELFKKEKEYERLPGLTQEEIKAKKADLQSVAVFRAGPGTLSAVDWSIARKEAYAALSIFLTFGVAGWFSSFTNHRKYNLADCYGLLTLCDQRVEQLKKIPADGIETTHPLVSGGWKYLNGFLLAVLNASKIPTADSAQWRLMSKKWAETLTPAQIGELVLADVFAEVAQPIASTSALGPQGMLPVTFFWWGGKQAVT
ncbi:hypothetical protein PGT21_000652 [Puccinia graminis f. sp. tritici]|uniref:Golgi to ER traffic-protein n=1 Tax=Puccinia graminis f. sp. tritici TaxID=56615 RepID=A0A5B0M2C8_PUCGR|nr:hypothetical protein PGTUg99_002323 [Puccinia graminis f. sp. tritici]KAA1071247.1 hypothetical protein PGT21_000652 [Puccinia graminis f. sp. tritici]